MTSRGISARIQRRGQALRHFVVHQVLHADDPPHRLALGAAIGMFVTFTPTVGAQMALVVFITWLLGANKLVGLPIVWISNPATIVPIYYAAYVVGLVLMGWEPVDRGWWAALAQPPSGWWQVTSFYWARMWDIAAPLWLGSLVIALLAACPTYSLLYHFICRYRERHPSERRGVS